jgi:gliding motility-associated-like protein
MKLRLSIIPVILFLLSLTPPARASHIVGGEVTYKCLGSNNYQITISIYEDCLTGLPEAIAQDDPAYLNIFDGAGNAVFVDFWGKPLYDSIKLCPTCRITVPANFSNLCVDNPPVTCLRKATFTKTYNLPPNTTGYTVVYQRCCRNASILNIINPASVGATYSCFIPPISKAVCNNSAVFKNYPPQIICINNPLVYDHSAIDPDGDSLTYEFCKTYAGGSNNDAKPIPNKPPFDTVTYVRPYSYKNPMGGYPKIDIDPHTGIISGMPNVLGRFVVTVCCHEWRKGVLINTVTREFQFVVTNCSKAVVANIPQYSTDFNTYIVDCADYTVHFDNTSKGGIYYHWDFGDTLSTSDTSSEFEPTHTYTDTGTYIVKLVVNGGSTCPDSISRFVKVYPVYKALYDFSGTQCPGSPISFKDLTSSTYHPIVSWFWDFGDSSQSTEQNPVHTYAEGDVYNVRFASKNFKGCTDTALKQVVIEKFKPFAGNDTTIVKGESINFHAVGGVQYTWSPSTNLNNTDGYNPSGYFPDTGIFRYVVHVVSSYGCAGDDDIKVTVVNQPAVFVPSGFTPNGDGLNDKLVPIVIGYKDIKFFNIYNRYGQQIFHTDIVGDGWDGSYGGASADIGTYYWELKLTDREGNQKLFKGDATLIR